MRRLSNTDAGGHAYDEHRISSVMKIAQLCKDLGVGGEKPNSVVADLGVGCGAILLGLSLAGGPGTAIIGTEMDENVFAAWHQICCNLHTKGFSGSLAVRNINANSVQSYDGIHICHLYDGNPSIRFDLEADNIHPANFAHMSMIGKLLASPSLDVLASTKASSSAIEFYAELDQNVRTFLPQFSIVVIKNAPLTNSRMQTTMYVRKAPYRRLRVPDIVGGAGCVSEELIQQLVHGCRTSQRPDGYGRFQDLVHPPWVDVNLYTLKVSTEDKQERLCFIGSTLIIPMQGFVFHAGGTVTMAMLPNDRDTVEEGTILGVVSVPGFPTADETDRLLILAGAKELWVVPVEVIVRALPQQELAEAAGKQLIAEARSYLIPVNESDRIPFRAFPKQLKRGARTTSRDAVNKDATSKDTFALPHVPASRQTTARSPHTNMEVDPSVLDDELEFKEEERKLKKLASDRNNQLAVLRSTCDSLSTKVTDVSNIVEEKTEQLSSLRKGMKSVSQKLRRHPSRTTPDKSDTDPDHSDRDSVCSPQSWRIGKSSESGASGKGRGPAVDIQEQVDMQEQVRKEVVAALADNKHDNAEVCRLREEVYALREKAAAASSMYELQAKMNSTQVESARNEEKNKHLSDQVQVLNRQFDEIVNKSNAVAEGKLLERQAQIQDELKKIMNAQENTKKSIEKSQFEDMKLEVAKHVTLTSNANMSTLATGIMDRIGNELRNGGGRYSRSRSSSQYSGRKSKKEKRMHTRSRSSRSSSSSPRRRTRSSKHTKRRRSKSPRRTTRSPSKCKGSKKKEGESERGERERANIAQTESERED